MKKTFTKSNQLLKKAMRIIPLGTQTSSKSYLLYVKKQAPLFITQGKGAHVWDVDGNRYVDLINSMTAVVLGYQYPAVDAAIQKQLKKGITFSLASPLEYELSQLLIQHIPCAEMVRFGKNGSDVTTAAVRVARGYTGRDHIAYCGHHGWHDWFIGGTPKKLGVPKATQKLTHQFTYNDIASLEKIFLKNKNKVAAVIMEPMSYEDPKPGFLPAVKKLAHKHGALLIFDEVITGFRFSMGGAQKLFKVTPDLATFGKAMANGMPLAALVGKRAYMKKIEELFISSTFGGETLSLAASIATIHELASKKVIDTLWKKGKYLQDKTNDLLKKHNLHSIMHVKGKPCWQVFSMHGYKQYSDLQIKTYIQQELLQEGFLWYGQHAMSFSHTHKDIDRLIQTYARIFETLRTLLDESRLEKALKGKPIQDVFKIRKT